MFYFRYFLILIFCFIDRCNSCTPFDRHNFFSGQSDANFINEFIEPLKSIIPVVNNFTVPNIEELIKQFQVGKGNEDVYLNFTQLVTKYNYPVEQHRVVTDDKYCLTMFRIPNPGAPAVMLMHGMLCSSDDFITPGTKTGIAYALADAGYDVWLGNCRGNKHSRCHLELSPECAEFWEFSFHEVGLYDIPAMIDYALEKTGKSQVAYVAHSQGTTAFFIMASEKPEYNKKISISIALSAVVFMGNVRSPLIQIVAPFVDVLSVLAKIIGIYELSPRNAFLTAVTSTFCGTPETAAIFCESFIFVTSGFNYAQVNATALPVIYGHYPAGSSTRTIVHYGQLTKSKKFENYDHGKVGNIIRYGQASPPDYPLEKVDCPVAVFYSRNDWLTSAPDTYKLLTKVPNVVEFYLVPCASYMHFDYLLAKDGDVLVNKEMLRILAKYTGDN